MSKISAFLLLAPILICCAGPARVDDGPFLDPKNLVVGAGKWRIDLVKDCGMSPDIQNRSLEALSMYHGAKIVFVLNSIPILDLETRTGTFICRETIAAFGPAV